MRTFIYRWFYHSLLHPLYLPCTPVPASRLPSGYRGYHTQKNPCHVRRVPGYPSGTRELGNPIGYPTGYGSPSCKTRSGCKRGSVTVNGMRQVCLRRCIVLRATVARHYAIHCHAPMLAIYNTQRRSPAQFNGFYRAMHFSAKRSLAIACRPSVCQPVCL